MTIVIFSTAYLPFAGGAETAIKGITDNLDNHHIILLTSRFDKSIPKAERSGNVLVYRLGFGNKFDKYFLPFLSFLKFNSIKKDLSKPIIFWGIMASYASIGIWLLKLVHSKIPFLLTIQEGDNEWDRNRFWWKMILSQANFVTALSSFLVDEVRKLGYKGEIRIVPNGVDLERFRNPDPRLKNGHRIISTSRRVYKNAIDIIEGAFAIIKKKYPDAELEIASDVPYEEIPAHLWRSDVFVRPSRTEGFGSSFPEAMSAGLPIIATSVGGIKDFLIDRETGLVVKVDDPEDLAAKIDMLFSDEGLRKKLRENGLKLVEDKYQWSKIGKDMEKIFLELCAS